MDQTPSLADLPDVPRPGVTDDAPPLGPFRIFRVPIRDIAALTGLDLAQLAAVDRVPIASALPGARVTETGVSCTPPKTWTWTSTSAADSGTSPNGSEAVLDLSGRARHNNTARPYDSHMGTKGKSTTFSFLAGLAVATFSLFAALWVNGNIPLPPPSPLPASSG